MTPLLTIGIALWIVILTVAAAGFGHWLGGGCMELAYYCSNVGS